MRHSLWLTLALLCGCAAAPKHNDSAVAQCEQAMPPGDYKVLEIAHATDGPIYKLLPQPSSQGDAVHIEDWRLHRPKDWPPVSKVTTVLFESGADKLAVCSVGNCSPGVIWLRLDTRDRWIVEREDISICTVR